jgi:hypothetical protein
MKLTIELEQEEEGRWIAAVPDLPRVRQNEESQVSHFLRIHNVANLQAVVDRLIEVFPVLSAAAAQPCIRTRRGKESKNWITNVGRYGSLAT